MSFYPPRPAGNGPQVYQSSGSLWVHPQPPSYAPANGSAQSSPSIPQIDAFWSGVVPPASYPHPPSEGHGAQYGSYPSYPSPSTNHHPAQWSTHHAQSHQQPSLGRSSYQTYPQPQPLPPVFRSGAATHAATSSSSPNPIHHSSQSPYPSSSRSPSSHTRVDSTPSEAQTAAATARVKEVQVELAKVLRELAAVKAGTSTAGESPGVITAMSVRDPPRKSRGREMRDPREKEMGYKGKNSREKDKEPKERREYSPSAPTPSFFAPRSKPAGSTFAIEIRKPDVPHGPPVGVRSPHASDLKLDDEEDFPPLGGLSMGMKRATSKDEERVGGKEERVAGSQAVGAVELPPTPSTINVDTGAEADDHDTTRSTLESSTATGSSEDDTTVNTASLDDREVSTSTRTSSEAPVRPMDRFAATFVPSWLRNLPAPTEIDRLPPNPPFPPDSYALDHFPSAHTLSHPTPAHSRILFLSKPPPPSTEIIRPLSPTQALSSPSYYTSHFQSLLAVHLREQMMDARQATAHITPLHLFAPRPYNGPGSERQVATGHTYRVHIPGVREDAPRLAMGDKLEIRGLYSDQKVPSSAAVEAEVVGLTKAQGWVYLRSPYLAELDKCLPRNKNGMAEYQIRFSVSAGPVCVMQDAVSTLGAALTVQSGTARKWLFPVKEDLDSEEVSRKAGPEIDWRDLSLNNEQKAAIQAIVLHDHQVPFLISGPPGVSKTKTLVETAIQVLLHDPSAHILICAPSNPAADTIARRLGAVLTPDIMFRLNASNRTFAEVPDVLLPFCCISGDRFDLPSFDRLMRFRVVVCALQDAGILYAGHASNAEMSRMMDGVMRVFNPHVAVEVPRSHWTHLLLDEAAQASEPETTIAMSVVLPYDKIEEEWAPTVVLCGDVHQLGPIIPSQQARDGELDVSLLQRLFERDVYAKHPAARQYRGEKKRAEEGVARDGDGQDSGFAPFAHLVQNYRSIPSILMVPSAMFYHDSLVPSATDVSLLEWSRLPNPEVPILFQGCETEESCIDEGASWFNPGEINVVLELIQSLLHERPDIQQKEIAVITPWREQVWRMRAKLRGEGLHGVDVGNVETYQGGEFRVTILSCVRSSKRFLKEDKRTNTGLYNEPRRFNVAITRAKELLVVVGNANLLKTDPYWNGFLQIMLRNNLYRGPELGIEMTGAYISRIESFFRPHSRQSTNRAQNLLQYIVNDSGPGGARVAWEDYEAEMETEAEMQGLFLAGEVARETLRFDDD